MNYKRKLERNLTLYYIRGIFEKRPYLPIITIYVTTIAGVTLSQIGIIASITAIVSLIVEIPSGYISDKVGHKKALLFGSFLMTISTLSYMVWQNFFGACMGMVVFWAGAAFHSGTIQSFIYETLKELGRDDDYASVASRGRRWTMAGDIFLVALVPLTYKISPILPFLIGFFVHACAFVLYMFMTTPKKVHQEIKEAIADGFFSLLNTVKNRREIALFIFLGMMTATHNKLPQFREIYFQEIGVPVWFFGLILSITGIVTIFLTYTVPFLEKTKPKIFYGIDLLFACSLSLLIGLIGHPVFGVMICIIFVAYQRIRLIVIHSHLLKNCPTQDLKATYLSMYAFFENIGYIFIPLALGYLVGYFGLQKGYFIFGILFFIMIIPIYFKVCKNLSKNL